jgi:hypothetical protein
VRQEVIARQRAQGYERAEATTMIHIDTLAFVQRLQAAGMPREQAEAIAEGIAKADTSSLSTKADFAEFRSEIKADFAEFRNDTKAEIADLRNETRVEFAKLRGEMKAIQAESFRHMLLQSGIIIGAVVALMKLLP